jgi:hypothetical protein
MATRVRSLVAFLVMQCLRESAFYPSLIQENSSEATYKTVAVEACRKGPATKRWLVYWFAGFVVIVEES